MAQSLAKNLIHLTFSTKNRRPFISQTVQSNLSAYMAGILREHKSHSLIANAVEDHVHLLFNLSKNMALCDAVEEVKKGSSKWMKTQGPNLADFSWQAGYGALSVSESNSERVKRYIAGQQEHHKKTSFQDEFRELLKRHNIEFDEHYVWD
jgi:REP element-mobilizing transposase RayT